MGPVGAAALQVVVLGENETALSVLATLAAAGIEVRGATSTTEAVRQARERPLRALVLALDLDTPSRLAELRTAVPTCPLVVFAGDRSAVPLAQADCVVFGPASAL